MRSSVLDVIEQNSLSFRLIPIPIREIFHLEKLPCNLFGLIKGLFAQVLPEGTSIDKEVIVTLLGQGHREVFIDQEDFAKIVEVQQSNLRGISRSLSVGDPIEKAKKFCSLAAINLRYLYDDPTNDEILELQRQSLINFVKFLGNNMHVQVPIFEEVLKLKHHFTLSQPFLSSMFLFGVLTQSKQYSERETENLFIASYFKDLGMAAIPSEIYDRKNLTLKEQMLFKRHPEHSLNFLEGRIGLSVDKLQIVLNHHAFTQFESTSTEVNGEIDLMMHGFETLVVNMTDIIAAMITGRPYQEPSSLYDALQHVRNLIGDRYPAEFKLFVAYFKNFFEQMK